MAFLVDAGKNLRQFLFMQQQFTGAGRVGDVVGIDRGQWIDLRADQISLAVFDDDV